MDFDVHIKEEPLDWDNTDAYLDFGNHAENAHFAEVNNDMEKELYTEGSVMTYDDDTLSRVADNIITVNVAETMKTEDEISFIKQVIAEESEMHDPALILPTDLEIYAKGMKTLKSQKGPKEITHLHRCRKGCDKTFSTLTVRALHETHEHKNSPRNIRCNICNKKFENFFDLTRHMPKHRNFQRNVCSHCSTNFNSYIELHNHWKTNDNCIKSVEEELKMRKSQKQNHISNTSDSIRQKNENLNNYQNMPYNFAKSPISLPPPPLTFAEEVKIFAAKYQLKPVAKKRTSGFSLKTLQNGKKQMQMDIGIQNNYAVPTGINNFITSLEDVKIKKEPIDDEEMAATVNADLIDQIQIKNEPHDEYQNSFTKYLISNKKEAKVKLFNKHWDIAPVKEEINNELFYENEQSSSKIKAQINAESCKLNESSDNNINSSVSNNATISTIQNIVNNQQRLQAHPKILLSKANLLSMKNVKLFKLSPHTKIIKVSPSKQAAVTQLKSPEEKELDTQEKSDAQMTLNQLSKSVISPTPIKSDIDASMHLLLPDEIKCEQLPENFMKTLSKLQESIDAKDHVPLNVLEEVVENCKKKRNLPRWLIRYMAEQPQKKKIIEEMQQQFENANEIMKLSTDTSVLDDSMPPNQEITSKPLPVQPESFFLKVADSSDKELMIARRQYNDYFYAWICPMCYKEYTQKHTFINHLIGTHKICPDELKSLTVEVKPFLVTNRMDKVQRERKTSSTHNKKNDNEVTAGDVRPIFECPKCKRVYRTKQSVIDHGNSDCGRVPIYVCSVCSKPFASQSTLNCHMTIHTGELSYQCKHCDKRFRTNGQVRVHMRKHTGEKPFKCQVCTLSFTHRETLISHLSRHMDIKRYICKGCDKRFSTISALTTHRNVRPTTCGTLELDTQAIGPLIRVTNGQISFEPQRGNNVRARRKMCQEILTEIQNIPKNKEHEHQEQQQNQNASLSNTC